MKTAAVIVLYKPDIDLVIKNITGLANLLSFFIIDNSPEIPPPSLLRLKEVINTITYIPLNDNVGLAAAQNIALTEILSDSSYSHVIFFDQDSILSRHAFDALIKGEEKILSKGVKLGAVGPACFDPNNGRSYPISSYNGVFIRRKFLKNEDLAQASFLIASGMLTRTEVIRTVGRMDERFFIDYIDVEWSYRASSMGYQLYAIGSAKMSHLIGDSRVKFFGRTISKHSALRRYYLLRNSILVLKLPHISLGYKSREILLSFARFITFFYYSDERLQYLKLSARAISDSIGGHYGKIRG